MARPWGEFGYTVNGKERLDAHKKHKSSNYLMNLAEATCARNFPQYQIHQFIVYKLWSVEQSWAAEILLTRPGGGYTSTGLGFNHHPAGLSNDSANDVSVRRWNSYAAHALQYSPLYGKKSSNGCRILSSFEIANYQRQTEILVERERKAAEEALHRGREERVKRVRDAYRRYGRSFNE
ncbi:hypothetical protein IWZ01DRAFT_506961 [Phyllosticta capitalensis]